MTEFCGHCACEIDPFCVLCGQQTEQHVDRNLGHAFHRMNQACRCSVPLEAVTLPVVETDWDLL